MILALETSCSTGSIALADQGSIVSTHTFAGEPRHSRTLFPALESLTLPNHPIEKILVGLGPGSFSGIRVALAAAQAIAAVKNAVVVGIHSPWSIALQFPDEARLGIFADARRGEFYVTEFSHGALLRDTYLIPRAALGATAAVMSRAVSAEVISEIADRAVPRASDFLTLPANFQYWITTTNLEPVYLRDAVAAV